MLDARSDDLSESQVEVLSIHSVTRLSNAKDLKLCAAGHMQVSLVKEFEKFEKKRKRRRKRKNYLHVNMLSSHDTWNRGNDNCNSCEQYHTTQHQMNRSLTRLSPALMSYLVAMVTDIQPSKTLICSRYRETVSYKAVRYEKVT